MRVVIAAAGSRGDAVPFGVLAARLVARGHDVTVVTHASLAHVMPDGPRVVTVASDPGALLAGPAGTALRRGDLRALNRTRNVFAEFLQSFGPTTREALAGADVLVASSFAIAAVDEAMRADVPVVRAHLWPEFDTLDGPMPLLPYAWTLPTGVRRRARGALRRVEPYFAGVDGGWADGRLDLRAAHPTGLTTATLGSLHAYSPLLAEPVDDSRTVVTGWWREAPHEGLSERTRALLASGDEWIAVGFGSMHQNSPGRVVDVVTEACRRLGVRALVQLDGAPREADGVVVGIDDEPHHALFAQVRAVVHHGGSGTTGTALATGAPSIVVPHFADQYHWAHRLHTLDLAPAPLPRRLLTAGLLTRRLRAAMSAGMRERAVDLGRQVATEDGAGVAVAAIEQFVGGA